MAKGDVTVFDEAKAYMVDGGWEPADSIKIALITNAVVPTAATSEPGMDATATTTFTECSTGGNYTQDDEVLDTLANCVTEAAGTMTFDDTGASVSWAVHASNPTDAYYGIVYNSTDSKQRAIAFIDLNGGSAVDMTAGPLTITWHASGIFTIA